MKVHLPSPLHSYSGGRSEVDAEGKTLRSAIESLEQQFPGIAFRIVDEAGQLRRHIRIFVDGQALDVSAGNDLDFRLKAHSEIHIVAALSGG